MPLAQEPLPEIGVGRTGLDCLVLLYSSFRFHFFKQWPLLTECLFKFKVHTNGTQYLAHTRPGKCPQIKTYQALEPTVRRAIGYLGCVPKMFFHAHSYIRATLLGNLLGNLHSEHDTRHRVDESAHSPSRSASPNPRHICVDFREVWRRCCQAGTGPRMTRGRSGR